jgi:hypothetical protein
VEEGILVKCFLSLYNEVFEKYGNTWIAIATPFENELEFLMDVILD